MTKRITIQSGDYVLLSDIPNEQVFNLVKECFENAGFPSTSSWEDGLSWSAFYAVGGCSQVFNSCSSFGPEAIGLDKLQLRKLSLSDVFNSTNGGFGWKCFNDCVIFNKSVVFTNSGSAGLYTEDKHIITIKRVIGQNNETDTYKITKAYDINNLQHMDISSVQGRALGKSTAHHLELISKAMKSPEQWVKVTNDDNSTMWGTILAGNEIKHLCEKLGLDWMEFDNNNQRIRYMPYQTVKMVTKWEVIA